MAGSSPHNGDLPPTNISDEGHNKDVSIILLSDKPQLDEGQNKDGSTNISDKGQIKDGSIILLSEQKKDGSIILLSDKSTSDNAVLSKPQLDEGQNKDGSTNISDEGQNKDGSIILLSDKSTCDNVILSNCQLDEGQNKDGSIILLCDKSTSDNVILSKPQLDEGQNKDGSTNILGEEQNKDGSIILLSDKSISDNVILSKRQLAQRARREREKLERPPSLPRFFPSLTPSRRQRAQLERAKSKRICIQSSTVSEKIPEVAVTDALGPSTATIIQSDPFFSCRDNDSSMILSSNKTTGDNLILSKRQSGQRARRERERLEHSTISRHFRPSLAPSCQGAQLEQAKSKGALIQSSAVSKKIPEVAVSNLSGPSMTTIIQSDLPFNCRNKDGSVILASNKPIGHNFILSKYPLEQRAQQEHQRLEHLPYLSRFFPLNPSCHQRAQLEREKSESSLVQKSTVSMKIPEVAMTNVLGPSMFTFIRSEPPFNFRNKVGSIILSRKKSTCDRVILSKRQSAQRVRRERERLESKRVLIQPSIESEKTPDVVTNVSGPSMTTVIQSNPPFSCPESEKTPDVVTNISGPSKTTVIQSNPPFSYPVSEKTPDVVTNVSGPSMITVMQSNPPFSCWSKDGSVILSSNKIVDKPTGDTVILSNRQAGQRARRERERLGRSPVLPRFFPSLTPSRRQRAQIERAKSKRALTQASIVSPKNPQLAATYVTSIIASAPPFSSSEKTTTKTVEEFQEETSRCSLEKPEVGVELTMDTPSVCSSSKITMTRTLEKPEVVVEITVQRNVSGSSPEKPAAVEERHDEPSRCSLEKPEVKVEITVQSNVSGSTPEKPAAVEEVHDEPTLSEAVEEFHGEPSCSLEKPEVKVEITVPTNVSKSTPEKSVALEELHDEPPLCSSEKPEVQVELTVPTKVSGSTPEKSEAVEEFRDVSSLCSLEKPEGQVEITVPTNVTGSSPDEHSRFSLEKPEEPPRGLL